MKSVGLLREQETGTIVVDRLEVADGFWSRFLGLQFRKELPFGHGLLLVPCRSVHTFWMRFAIDIVLLSDSGIVLEVHREVKPWKTVVPKAKGHAILEFPAAACTVQVGQRLVLEPDPERPCLKRVAFLLQEGS